MSVSTPTKSDRVLNFAFVIAVILAIPGSGILLYEMDLADEPYRLQAAIATEKPVLIPSSLVETVKNNVYTLTPTHGGEVGEEEQLNSAVRELAKKYQIFSVNKEYFVDIAQRKRLDGATIYVGARQF